MVCGTQHIRRKIQIDEFIAAELRKCVAVVFLFECDVEYRFLDNIEAQMVAYRDDICILFDILAAYLRDDSEVRMKSLVNFRKYPAGLAVPGFCFRVDAIRRCHGSFTG